MTAVGGDREAFAIGMRIANGYLRRHPATNHQRDDIVSDALLGVTKALRDHDPGKGPLGAYVVLRAQKTILDGLRARSPVSRWFWERGDRIHDPLSLEQLCGTGRHGDQAVFPPVDPHGEDGYAQVDARLEVLSLLALLPPRLRAVLQAHDLDGEGMRTIGARSGVSESRICQMRREALTLLREHAA